MSLSVENIFQLSGINLEANLTTPNSQLIQEPPRNSQLNNELLEKEQEEYELDLSYVFKNSVSNIDYALEILNFEAAKFTNVSKRDQLP